MRARARGGWRRAHRPPPQPPPWWPEGQQWPPPAFAPWARPGRVVWRVGCLLIVLLLFISLVGTVMVGLAAAALGVAGIAWSLRLAAVGALLIGVLGVAGGVAWARRLAAPVTELIVAAGRVEAGDFGARVTERGPREVRAVAGAFNAMSARLEATEARRRSFLADVTHELRTPLSVIRGQAEGIADGLYPGDAAHLAPILGATRTLETLVDDLRTLTLSESGSLVLERESVDLAVLVNETLESFRANAEAGGVQLREQVAETVPLVNADPARLRSILANLLANAVRYTPPGGRVTVRARPGPGLVEIEVADTGAGIPPELLPNVFERFARGPGSQGSGLGLAIAGDLVVAHGGTIKAESEPGLGTIFRFTIPPES